VANAGGPYSALTGSSASFNGSSSSDPDGTIASYAWNFGDNNSGTISSIAKGEISSIDLKLQVEGAPPTMESEKACTLTIDPQCNEPALFDEYEGVSGIEEKQHLDRFATYVKAAGPEAVAYVISYEGRSACYYEAQWRADRVRKYLVEKHGLSLLRVIGVDGGVREHWSVDLFVEPQGKCGPLPRPELPRDEARFRGQCSER
jgi:hypothetical protein